MVPQAAGPGNGSLPQSVLVTAAAGTAVAVPALAAALRALLATPPTQWPTAGLAPVKTSTVRSVLRGMLGGIDVHVKLFRSGRLSQRPTDWARDTFAGPRGERELRQLLTARAAGLPAVEPLAHGVAHGDDVHCSFLVTRTVAASRQFDFRMPAAMQFAVGALLRAAHDRGLLPGDLHPGNVVIDDAGSPWLLDLTSVQHRSDPTLEQRAKGLALFCQLLDAGPLDPAAHSLLRGYRSAGAELPARFDACLHRAARVVRSHALQSFGRRSSRACRHTELSERRRGAARWYWHLDPARPPDPGVRQLAETLGATPPTPDKTGRRGSVWLQCNLVVKQRDQGAAQKLWRAMYWLLFAGVPQAPPIALRTFHRLGHVFALRLPDPDLASELARGSLSQPVLRETAAALGRAVGRLHAHGLRNRDLKFENLVRDPGSGEVRMVDLDGIRRKAPSDSRGQGHDLGRLLAAFRAAGEPGGITCVRTFWHAYLRARKRLLQPAEPTRLRRTAAARAKAWASAHSASFG